MDGTMVDLREIYVDRAEPQADRDRRQNPESPRRR